MNIDSIKQSLLRKLRKLRYRRAFANAHVGEQIAAQLRALRESRHLSQEKMAAEIGIAQPRISVMEKPNYQNYNIRTLKRIAAFYDVLLDVRFVSFREFLERILVQTRQDLAPPSFGQAFVTTDAGDALRKIPEGQGLAVKQEGPPDVLRASVLQRKQGLSNLREIAE